MKQLPSFSGTARSNIIFRAIMEKRKRAMTQCGIRQGCPIGRTIWNAFMHMILTELARQHGDSWLREHISLFADDTHMGWTFHADAELFHS